MNALHGFYTLSIIYKGGGVTAQDELCGGTILHISAWGGDAK